MGTLQSAELLFERTKKTPVPGLGEDFAGAERVLDGGVRVEGTLPLVTPLWIPVLLFPEADLWGPSTTWLHKTQQHSRQGLVSDVSPHTCHTNVCIDG